ncbi:aminopeptidase N [Terriglobus roseus DSM 18391]|uniref:Aminopeptidase N n=1 Tax=Terriglobus roseus (strain DSM 18391 / NRRL B-41598 / KBS 63) TaxID=926566 RepID=I3ZH55_TERRK|nr:M1 family aminopeptidase [Terriglobus roseus]AFL88573.1 aminopeptidase N [Terriglobus roseus DSM 18391]AFL88914.1 aminopeptidase N [Terriglobus roseus DSM 18391]
MFAIRKFVVATSAAALSISAAAQTSGTRQPLQVTGYTIDAQLDPVAQRLTATAAVTFTAVQDLMSATFELNNGLRITKITGPDGKPLDSDRDARRSTVTVSLPVAIPTGTTSTFTFTYAGILKEADTSPVEGIKTAALATPISMLLYPGRWFPMVGLYTNRFTMNLHATVPSDEIAVSSGFTGKKSVAGNKTEFDFAWSKPGFPGTLIAGKFLPAGKVAGSNQISIYVTEPHKAAAADYAGVAAQQQEYFTNTFGQPESGKLQIVELPDDSVSASWGPEIAAIAGNRIGDKNSHRLLANTISRQWWGSEISPATLNDAWITNGMARYSELMNLEETGGKTALQNAIPDIEAGALAYDTAPLSTLARVDPFSPQFQSMTLEKGAMVFHMLRYQLGDDKFLAFLKGLLSQYTDKPVRSADLEVVAKAQGGEGVNLRPFFAQWIDGTGAPSFQDKFTIYRLGSNKGFRTIGSVSQDLDLFRMPIDLRIETDGKTETRKIDVTGTDSAYTIETFGRPRRIVIDPDNWVLKSTPDLAVRVAVLKGQQLVAQGDLIGALAEYQKALDSNKNSALANYRIAEIFFTQRNYQSSANSYRDSLRGDGEPRWTQVWSHIGLGKIFDLTGQRDRAVQEYRLAVQTNDNTQGAINEARALLQKPFERARSMD